MLHFVEFRNDRVRGIQTLKVVEFRWYIEFVIVIYIYMTDMSYTLQI